ncbi:MAG: hypothetical protein WAS25_11360 [Geothrix sp.]|uniref:Uncharacterized protein n=1 Tax=Candidatus Geothrix skivensis TaxID=2954439 RepID=A0A9D7SGH4_9BACT|nr:hypothetical protein [Holophagaceae bacterium]MBK9797242.1 hypothetical protein [Candidatus Geothrix skivensis]
MNQNLVPTCIQLDDVVDPEPYLALALQGFSIPITALTPEVDTTSDQQ